MRALKQFRDQHGDPEAWSADEFDEYLQIGDQQVLAAEAAHLLIGSTSSRLNGTAPAAVPEEGIR
ncbi:hypothetical protein [Streptomyces sp. Lzd4kr]|uniref:hypothetical protein n=1 Tax=Streptomyces sp. Y7 TaxID=3342392 RepID=UPI0022B4F4DD|nr:hypothetical protein [Streptomyces sp. Lzd4kr]